MTPPAFYSVDELATVLGLSTKTVRKYITEGLIPHHRMGRHIRISEAQLQEFLKATTVRATAAQDPPAVPDSVPTWHDTPPSSNGFGIPAKGTKTASHQGKRRSGS